MDTLTFLNYLFTDYNMNFQDNYPQTYYQDTEDKEIIEIVVPAVTKDELDLSVVDNHLVVSFNRLDDSKAEQKALFTGVRRNFEKRLALRKETNVDDISSSLKNGVFRIEIAKTPPTKTSIPILEG